MAIRYVTDTSFVVDDMLIRSKQFELIQKLDGHHGEIWALAVSSQGAFVVTGSHDKSIRIWEKTDEPLFLEEEREREMDALYDTNLADNMNREDRNGGGGDDDQVFNGEETEDVHKQTAETLMAGERIMEALEIADADLEAIKAWEEEKAKLSEEAAKFLPAPSRNPELLARGDITAQEHVLRTLQKIPTASMEDALLVLPFRQVVSLLEYLDYWAENVRGNFINSSWSVADLRTQNLDITLTSRLLYFLVRTHASQLISNRTMRTPLISLRSHLREALNQQRKTIGFNLAALKFVRTRWEGEKIVGLLEGEGGWDEEKVRKKIEEGKGKRKRVKA